MYGIIKKHLNIAESTSLQNVNLAEFILAFLEGTRKLAPRENNPPYGISMELLTLTHSMVKNFFS